MGKKFEYGAIGTKNLEVVGKKNAFTNWMYAEIRQHIAGHVLEVGSGIGTYSAEIRKDDKGAVFSDIDAEYVSKLKRRFPKNRCVLLDIGDERSVKALRKAERFDTIIFLNVLEHVKDDRKALRLLKTLLRPGGRIICLVPTHKALYNVIDEAVGHHRRYTKKELVSKVKAAGYTVERVFSFNFFGMFGWFVNGRILRRRQIDQGAMKIFTVLVPFFKAFERYVLFKKVGMSTIIVARK